MQPFARLVEASGCVYSRAPAFIAELRAAMADMAAIEAGEGDGAGERAPAMPSLKPPVEEFHRDPRYGGDLHRAAGTGLSAAEIRRAIIEARDLSKKGNLKRQTGIRRTDRRQGSEAGGVG